MSPVPRLQMPRVARTSTLLVLVAAFFALLALPVSPASASSNQTQILMDDTGIFADPAGTLSQLRGLGVQMVRISVKWQQIAPSPNSHRRPHFDATNPAAYPARNWRTLDTILQTAAADAIKIDFDAMGGAPEWATGPHAPHQKGKVFHQWEPSAKQFGLFVRALGTRYSGSYTPPGASGPLPRADFWTVWNEPDYGPSLAPQGVYPNHLTVPNAPHVYRNLVDAAWSALHATGHGSDTFVFGEVAPRGEKKWGVFSGMTPLLFLRSMYCLNGSYRPLRGSSAALQGCPTGGAGTRRFRSQHPALFQATGFSDHPYMRWYQPNREQNPDPTNHLNTSQYSSLGVIGNLLKALDRVQRAYGSSAKFTVYDTEFGYITSPPNKNKKYPYVSPSTAAYYLNWAEYIHWQNPRVASYNQYLLKDELPANGLKGYGFNSGLIFYSGQPKPMLDAYRLPLYLPTTSASHGQSLEVWGCARPARFAGGFPASVQLQFAPSGSSTFTTMTTITITDPSCYFDTHATFPSSGTVRLVYTYPSSQVIESRHVQVTIH